EARFGGEETAPPARFACSRDEGLRHVAEAILAGEGRAGRHPRLAAGLHVGDAGVVLAEVGEAGIEGLGGGGLPSVPPDDLGDVHRCGRDGGHGAWLVSPAIPACQRGAAEAGARRHEPVVATGRREATEAVGELPGLASRPRPSRSAAVGGDGVAVTEGELDGAGSTKGGPAGYPGA